MNKLIAIALCTLALNSHAQVYDGRGNGRFVDVSDRDFNAEWEPLAVVRLPAIIAGDTYLITANSEVTCQCDLSYRYTFALAHSVGEPAGSYRQRDLPLIQAGIFRDAMGAVIVPGEGDGVTTQSRDYIWHANEDRPEGLYIFAMGRASGAANGIRLSTDNVFVQVYKLGPNAEILPVIPGPPPPPPAPEPLPIPTDDGIEKQIQEDIKLLNLRMRKLERRIKKK